MKNYKLQKLLRFYQIQQFMDSLVLTSQETPILLKQMSLQPLLKWDIYYIANNACWRNFLWSGKGLWLHESCNFVS